jgi:hypothetical protein
VLGGLASTSRRARGPPGKKRSIAGTCSAADDDERSHARAAVRGRSPLAAGSLRDGRAPQRRIDLVIWRRSRQDEEVPVDSTRWSARDMGICFGDEPPALRGA